MTGFKASLFTAPVPLPEGGVRLSLSGLVRPKPWKIWTAVVEGFLPEEFRAPSRKSLYSGT